jgi:hypothetical protein
MQWLRVSRLGEPLPLLASKEHDHCENTYDGYNEGHGSSRSWPGCQRWMVRLSTGSGVMNPVNGWCEKANSSRQHGYLSLVGDLMGLLIATVRGPRHLLQDQACRF